VEQYIKKCYNYSGNGTSTVFHKKYDYPYYGRNTANTALTNKLSYLCSRETCETEY